MPGVATISSETPFAASHPFHLLFTYSGEQNSYLTYIPLNFLTHFHHVAVGMVVECSPENWFPGLVLVNGRKGSLFLGPPALFSICWLFIECLLGAVPGRFRVKGTHQFRLHEYSISCPLSLGPVFSSFALSDFGAHALPSLQSKV